MGGFPGGEGVEGPGGRNWGISGGVGLNFFFRGRSVHQAVEPPKPLERQGRK